MLRKISIANASTHPLIKAWPEDTLGDIYEKLCKHNAVWWWILPVISKE